jgi:hypothetical protein
MPQAFCNWDSEVQFIIAKWLMKRLNRSPSLLTISIFNRLTLSAVYRLLLIDQFETECSRPNFLWLSSYNLVRSSYECQCLVDFLLLSLNVQWRRAIDSALCLSRQILKAVFYSKTSSLTSWHRDWQIFHRCRLMVTSSVSQREWESALQFNFDYGLAVVDLNDCLVTVQVLVSAEAAGASTQVTSSAFSRTECCKLHHALYSAEF